MLRQSYKIIIGVDIGKHQDDGDDDGVAPKLLVKEPWHRASTYKLYCLWILPQTEWQRETSSSGNTQPPAAIESLQFSAMLGRSSTSITFVTALAVMQGC